MLMIRRRGMLYFFVMMMLMIIATSVDIYRIVIGSNYFLSLGRFNYASTALVSSVFIGVGTMMMMNSMISLNQRRFSGLTLDDFQQFKYHVFSLKLLYVFEGILIATNVISMAFRGFFIVYTGFTCMFITLFVFLHIYRNFSENDARRLSIILKEVRFLISYEESYLGTAEGRQANYELQQIIIKMIESFCITNSSLEQVVISQHLKAVVRQCNSSNIRKDTYHMIDQIIKHQSHHQQHIIDNIMNLETKDHVTFNMKIRLQSA